MTKKLLVVFLALTLVFAFATTALAAADISDYITISPSASSQEYVTNVSCSAAQATNLSGGATVSFTSFTVTEGGSTVGTGTHSATISSITPGKHTYTIKVVANVAFTDATQNITAGEATHTFVAYVGDPDANITVTNNDTSNQELVAPSGSGTTYVLHIDKDVVGFDNVTVALASGSGSAELAINGNVVTSPVALNRVDNSDVTIVVTPENENPAKKKTYTIEVEDDYDVAELRSMGLFSPNAQNEITGTYNKSANSVGMDIDFTGASVAGSSLPTGVMVTSDAGDYSVNLNKTALDAASLSFTLTVTALDGTTTADYTVELTQLTDAKLTGLKFYSQKNENSRYEYDVDGDELQLESLPEEIFAKATWESGNVGDLYFFGKKITPDRDGWYTIELSMTEEMPVAYATAGSSSKTTYETYELQRPLLIEAFVNDEDSSKKAKDFELNCYKTKFSVDIDEDWDDDLYIYLEAAGNAEIEQVDIDKKKDVDPIKKNSNYYKFDLDSDGETKVVVTVSCNGEEEDYTLTITNDGSSGSGLIDKLYVASDDSTSSKYQFDVYPSVDEDVTDYYVFIPEDDRTSTFFVRIDTDDDVEWEFEGKTYDSEDWSDSVSMPRVGADETYDIEIDGEDYTITVYVGDEDDDDSDVLDKLAIKSGSTKTASKATAVSFNFNPNTASYTVNCPSQYVWITPTADDSGQLLFINGEKVSSGKVSQMITLTKGKTTTVEVYVVSENREETKTYTLKLSMGGANTLRSLSVGNLSLTPAFSNDIHNYTAKVANATSSIQVSAIADSTSAVVTISGTAADGTSLGSSRSGSGTFTLKEGLNYLTISVLDGTSYNYFYVSIYRIPAKFNVVVSNQMISINNGAAQTITAYNVNGNNFVQLRDLAKLMKDSSKKFNVGYDNPTRTVTMTTGSAYTGDATASLAKPKRTVASNQSFRCDGKAIYPMAYNIDDVNYVMVRDLASLMDFGCSYDNNSRTIRVTTTSSYVFNR